eukprot:XP_001611262.1 variant erythrocyte surface antigen-1, beta subunit [Babesia bovis T2Bo]
MWSNPVVGSAGGSGSAGSAVGGKGGSGVAAATADPIRAAQEVHLLARIFLGSVCLIWSGLSQLGFLTGSGSDPRWSTSSLHKIDDADQAGLGSFMAAMGYDLDRLNQGSGTGQKGEFVQKLLNGEQPAKDGIKWNEFKNGTSKDSVAEYYSTIYGAASAGKDKKTEDICKEYPLLVLHILASGYFRAGSAGAKGVTTPASPAPPKKPDTETTKKDDTPRKPRTIREILYWLSALPYSEKYKGLVGRMGDKYPKKETNPQETVEQIELYNDSSTSVSTTLQRKDITHYLLAACGYCPLVLIGIQGTIATSGKESATQGVVMWTYGVVGAGGAGAGADQKKCPNHSKDRNYRCTLEDANKAPATPQAQSSTSELQPGEVCYGGYHLEVSKFGPLHGMYANGLFGFQMEISPAQCLDQLRIYVYHCFYQLYFLRKQCSTAVEGGVGGGSSVVLGWQSCRYGSGVNPNAGVNISSSWLCETQVSYMARNRAIWIHGVAGGTDCQCKKSASHKSPLMYFLCDALGSMACKKTIGKSSDSETNPYPDIEDHMNKSVDSNGKEQGPHRDYPQLCPVPMGWSNESTGSSTSGGQVRVNHFKGKEKYPAHCTGNTLSHLLEYYCDPGKCQSGTLVVLLRLLACITPTVPRTLGDLFGFYYYIVYIEGQSGGGQQGVHEKLVEFEKESKLHMPSIGGGPDAVVEALTKWNGNSSSAVGGACQHKADGGSLKTLYGCSNGKNNCCQYLSPLSGQQYGQLSPAMAGTYLSWLVYLIGEFQGGLKGLKGEFQGISCTEAECKNGKF